MKLNATFLLSLALALAAHTQAHSAKEPSKAKAPGKSAAANKGKNPGQRHGVAPSLRSPPAAKLDNGHDTLLETGCLDSEKISQIKERLQIDMPSTAALSAFQAAMSSPCLPYSAALTQPLVRNAMALLTPDPVDGHIQAWLYSRSVSDSNASPSPARLTPGTESLRQITVPRLRAEGIEGQDMPAHLQWEVDLMAKQMVSALKLDPAAHQLRLTLTPDSDSGTEKIYAIELIESATGQRAEIAVWLERDKVPGAYFSMQGLDYERLLWKSPVQFTRISRGVGPGVTTVSRRVAVKPNQKNAKPRMVIRTLKIKKHHIGIDFAAPTGTPVVAVADGEVIHASVNGGYGNLVIVDHGEGHHTYYAHLSAYASDLQPGVLVRRGEEIGLVGSTGFSTGPHLHFEIRKEGLYIDPALKQNKLKFWILDAQEQPQLLARLLRLQLVQAPAAVVTQMARPD